MSELENHLEEYRKGFLRNFRKLEDSPALENPQFNFSTYGKQLARYIASKDLPTPLTIGLNGEWGSGKTTMIKIIQRNVANISGDSDYEDTTCINFNAWAAEKTDIVTSLFQKISGFLDTKQFNRSWMRKIKKPRIEKFNNPWMTLCADIALRELMIGMTYENVKDHFKKPPPSIEDISKQIEDLLGGKRLVIFIDDLDRCNASNILELLETIKNVLGAKNLIFCITVDMKQIERAWELRYKSDLVKIESKEYIEKLFPIIFSLPPKTDDDVGSYHDSLVALNDKHGKLRTHLVESLTSNPRKIKRMLNIIFFLIQNYDLKNIEVSEEMDIRKQCQLHFSFIITWAVLTINHRKISEVFQTEPSAIIPIALFFNMFDSFTEFKEEYMKMNKDKNPYIKKGEIAHNFARQIFTSSVSDILKIIVEEDQLAFRTLKQTSKFITNPEEFVSSGRELFYDNKFIANGYDGESKIFKKITQKGGLVSA